MNKILARFFILTLLFSCESNAEKQETVISNVYSFEIKNLNDKDYPDNPDIGFRAKDYDFNYFTSGKIQLINKETEILDLQFNTFSNDSILLSKIDISEFIPTIPEGIKKDRYLSHLSCVNQEWNRNQVQFDKSEFESSDKQIVRLDVARNCLNAYLWEVIAYKEENGKTVPFAHGWFDFTHELYAELFEIKNGISYAKYKKSLENWVDPQSWIVNLSKLRKITQNIPIQFTDSSNAMYPLEGARKKKFKEIITPATFKTMKDLQSDSTTLATFSVPGFYNRKDPRTTQLGRIYNLEHAELNKMKSKLNGADLHEIKLEFEDRNCQRVTSLVIGGLNLNDFPVLNSQKANDGWKNSMGIGNHTFYEDYQTHNKVKVATNPYYALLLDKKGKWLDSHTIGIDGPIFYFSDKERTILHVWLLSFERHALVGHYVLKIQ